MKKLSNWFDARYEIVNGFNWWIIPIALAVCCINIYLMYDTPFKPFLGIINLIILMPLSPLGMVKIKRRKDLLQ